MRPRRGARPLRLRALALLVALSSCTEVGTPSVVPPAVVARAAAPAPPEGIPAPPGPANGAPAVEVRNAELARDALDLAFRLESGRTLEGLSRFEGPVRLGLPADAPPALVRDADELVRRLRAEAGLPVTRVAGEGEITVELVPDARMARAVPGAACFVAPEVSSFAGWRAGRAADWTRLGVRTRMAVLIPEGAPPQEMRDCLHEEVAQALGPVGDLFRLTNSVFNDDNFHAVLTRHDMLVLRALYDPSLAVGMSAEEVAARLPGIVARINPRGGGGAAAPAEEAPEWTRDVLTALGGGRAAERRAAARRALETAAPGGRAAFAHYLAGRLAAPDEPEAAEALLARADALYRALPGTEVQRAHVALQRAALRVRTDPAAAEALAAGALGAARAGRNAALLASLQSVRARSLAGLGRRPEAEAARLDADRWARYGFGPA